MIKIQYIITILLFRRAAEGSLIVRAGRRLRTVAGRSRAADLVAPNKSGGNCISTTSVLVRAGHRVITPMASSVARKARSYGLYQWVDVKERPPLLNVAWLAAIVGFFFAIVVHPYTIGKALGIEINSLSFYLSDIFVTFTIVVYAMHVLVAGHINLDREIVPLLVFVSLFAAAVSLSLTVRNPVDVLREARILPYYLLILPLSAGVRSSRDATHLLAVIVIAGTASLGLFILVQFVGALPGMSGTGRLVRQVVGEETVAAALLLVTARLIGTDQTRWRLLLVALVVLLAGGLVRTGSESVMLATGIGLGVIALGSLDRPLVEWAIYLLGVGLGGLVMFCAWVLLSPYLQACVSGTCVTTGSIGVEESLGLRVKEWSHQVAIWAQYPLFGVGLGTYYQSYVQAPGRLVGGLAGSSTVFWLLMKTGIMGLVVWAWALLGGVRAFVRTWTNRDEQNADQLIGGAAVAVTVLIVGLFHSNTVTSLTKIPLLMVCLSVVVGIGHSTD